MVLINLNSKMLKFLKFLIITCSLLGIIVLFFQDIVILHPVKLTKEYVYKFDEPFEFFALNKIPLISVLVSGEKYISSNGSSNI